MTNPKKGESFLRISLNARDQLSAEVNWKFKNPHEAGHALGQLARTVIRGFEKNNPNKSREEIGQAVADGISCMLNSDEFLDGTDSDLMVEH